ncbi:lysostaphin resistance A-like protein [Maribacter sp. 2307ULW6-5]|uniref:CPBP family intramembrane glutamic endopeptidase n=1 Tax=Maribacter sp. 2307ULW6-5 TaxID=3386275 RepID=UPI0039BCE301
MFNYKFSIKRKALYVKASLVVLFLNLAICAPVYQIILGCFHQPMLKINGPFNGVYDAIIVLMISPFFEETIFKGIFLDGLLKKQSPVISIFFTALLFSVMHANPYLLTTIFFSAIFTGWLYYRTRNLALVIWIHFLHNLIGSIEGYALQDVRSGFTTGLDRAYGPNSLLLILIFVIFFLISFYVLYKGLDRDIQDYPLFR